MIIKLLNYYRDVATNQVNDIINIPSGLQVL